MSKKSPEQIISVAKDAFQTKSIVAFLGKPHYGKTVVSTLLYDALFHYFIPKNSDKFTAAVTKGFDTLYQTHKMMIEGKFPPPNLPGPIPEISIEISNIEVLGGKIELILRDMSGEDHDDLLLTEREPSELVNSILSEKASTGTTYGPFSYLAFARMYVILLDCSKFSTWRYEDLRYSQLVKSIIDMKNGIGEASQGKINVPIAIILTKADILPPDIQESAEDLVRKHTPQLFLRLSEYHNTGDKGFFKLGVDVEQATADEIKKIEKEYEEARNIEKAEAERQIQQEADKDASLARNKAIAEGKTPEQAEEEAQKVANEKKLSLQSIGQKVDDSSNKGIIESIQKIKVPMSYTHGEYIKFISWIIKNISKK